MPSSSVHIIIAMVIMPTLLILIIIAGPIVNKAYSERVQRLEDEAWLRAQCSDPHFTARMMRQHSDVCDRVVVLVPHAAALLLFQSLLAHAALPAAGLLLVAAPSVLLPYYCCYRDRRDLRRELPPYWRRIDRRVKSV